MAKTLIVAFFFNWGKYTEETDRRKETIRTPAKRERLWEENGNGSEVLKESEYYFRDCLISAYLLKIPKYSTNHRTTQSPCPGK